MGVTTPKYQSQKQFWCQMMKMYVTKNFFEKES